MMGDIIKKEERPLVLIVDDILLCAKCKKIRDDKGYWRSVEEFTADHSDAHLSRSLCPKCIKELYPEMAEKIIDKKKQKRPS